MTAEAATAFAERLKTDEALQNELAAAANPEERLAIARREGFDLSADDVGAVKETLGIQELSDEDLEKVAGGISDTAKLTIVVGTAAGSVTASLSAAVSIGVAAALI